MRGYLTPQQDATLDMRVRLPDDVDTSSLVAWANGRAVAQSVSGGFAVFRLSAAAGRAADWAITWKPGAALPRLTSCADRRRFHFRLHHARHARVVDVKLFVNGRRRLHHHGRRISSITLRRLPRGRFKMKIVATQSSGSQLISTRSYRGCKKSHPRTRGRHHRRRPR